MKSLLRIGSAVSLVLVLAFGAYRMFGARPVSDAKPATTRAYALVHYASWCHLCKDLEPKANEAKADAVAGGVEFVLLDYSDDATKQEADKKAASLGVDKFVSPGSTGFIQLVDATKTKDLGRITSDQTVDEIKSTFAKATH